ncbi:MAG: hypothetical protein JSR77_10590 [Planctomycetes bacterium]|nr:hypothetical protein [Planctomycetota bacterium]
MNARTALISLAVVLLLASATFVALRAPAPATTTTPQPTWLAGIDAVPLQRVEFLRDAAPAVTVEKGAGGVWICSADKSQPPWPADDTPMRAMTRLLSDAAPAPAKPGPAAAKPTVVLTTADSRRFAFSAVDNPLGESSLITLDDPPGASSSRPVKAGLAKAIEPAGVLAAWRTSSVFFMRAQSSATLHLETRGAGISVEGTGKRWRLTSPVTTRADPDSCLALSQAVGRLSAARLLGTPDAQARTWADTPTTFVTVSIPPRPGTDETKTLVQELRVGGPADARGDNLLAVVSAIWVEGQTRTPAWGPMLVAIDHAAIEALVPEPTAYLARQTLAIPAADVSALRLARCDDDPLDVSAQFPGAAPDKLATGPFSRVVLARSIDGWTKSTQQSTPAIAPGQDTIDALVKLLAQDAPTGLLLERPANTECLAALLLSGPSGDAADILGIGAIANQKLVVRSGRVFRVYEGPAAKALIEFLKEALPTEG